MKVFLLRCYKPWKQALFSLGRVYWKLNDSFNAIKNYEEYIAVATPNYEIGGVLQAAEYLLQVILNPNYHENFFAGQCSQHLPRGRTNWGQGVGEGENVSIFCRAHMFLILR